MSSNEAIDFVESDKFHGIFKQYDYNANGTIDQRDAYFWARTLVGETYQGPLSTGEWGWEKFNSESSKIRMNLICKV